MTRVPRPAFKPLSTSHPSVREMQRRIKYGKLRPMHQPSWIDRLLGRG